MSNNINTLRDELFDTLNKLKKKEITIDEAKAVCDVGQTIINTAKLEVDYIRVSGDTYNKNTFIDAPSSELTGTSALQGSSVFRIGNKEAQGE